MFLNKHIAQRMHDKVTTHRIESLRIVSVRTYYCLFPSCFHQRWNAPLLPFRLVLYFCANLKLGAPVSSTKRKEDKQQKEKDVILC